MKRSALVLLLWLVSCEQPADFAYADGQAGRFSDWQGRWVVLNYWAEWCAPCRDEIPELNRLYAEIEGHGVLVVGVNFDGVPAEALAELVSKMGIEFPVLISDPRQHFGYDLPSVLPTTVVIDPSGAVVETLIGPQTRASLEDAVGSLTAS